MATQDIITYLSGADNAPRLLLRIDPEALRGPAEQAMAALTLLGGGSISLRFIEAEYALMQEPAAEDDLPEPLSFLPATLQVDEIGNCILHLGFADGSPGGLVCEIIHRPPLRPAPIGSRDAAAVNIMKRAMTRLQQAAPVLRELRRRGLLAQNTWQLTLQAESELRDGITRFLQGATSPKLQPAEIDGPAASPTN